MMAVTFIPQDEIHFAKKSDLFCNSHSFVVLLLISKQSPFKSISLIAKLTLPCF